MTLRADLGFGLRMAVAGRHDAWLRLALMVAGVGVGVTLLLLSLTGQSAVQGRAERMGWRSAQPATAATAPDEALFLAVTDYHGSTPMMRAYVAALGPHPPVPPGLERLPEPGEVAVSPALRRLMAETPDDQLDDRYPGRVTATIGDAGLAHADEMVALIGRTPEQMRAIDSDGVRPVRGFRELPSAYAFDLGVRLVLLVGAVLLLVPVVVFIVMATRVAAAERIQRLAALRLVGATRLQAAIVAGVEAGFAAAAGSVLGLLGYLVGRRVLAATVTFGGGHYFLDDVVVAPWLLLLVLAGVPVLALITTVLSLRRGLHEAAPLAVQRGGARRPPSARLAVPLVLGVGGQVAAVSLGGIVPDGVLDRITPLLVVLTFVGLVLVGPWLCLLAGRGMARLCRRLPGLIAARRIAADPWATFRAVSGVVLAAFVVTYSASVVDTSDPALDTAEAGALRPGVVEVVTAGAAEEDLALLLAEPGAVTTWLYPGGFGEAVRSCAELATVTTLRCSAAGDPDAIVRQRADVGRFSRTIARVLVPTGEQADPAAENRVRTLAARLVPNALIHTVRDRVDADARYLQDLGDLVRMGWHFVLVLAACSLTVGMLAGIVERRRPFALLRASGFALGDLRRVVLLETVVAMLITTAIGVGLGALSSYALAWYQDIPWRWPEPGVFGMIGVGVLAALALSALALPLLDKATRHDAVRYE